MERGFPDLDAWHLLKTFLNNKDRPNFSRTDFRATQKNVIPKGESPDDSISLYSPYFALLSDETGNKNRIEQNKQPPRKDEDVLRE